jgi:hypothetical protein
MIDLSHWLGQLLATDVPALPAPWMMRLGLAVGWALVLAFLGAGIGYKLSQNGRRWLALGLALWTFVPGPVSPAYWLGLAFNTPSLTAMLLAGWSLWWLLFDADTRAVSASLPYAVDQPRVVAASQGWQLWPLVALGYLLMLDTFAVLPLQIYAWGFSPLLLLGLLALSLLPWLLGGNALERRVAPVWLAPVALLLFAATRLPTGNLWDALLDPWLWLILQWLLVRDLYRRFRARTSPATIRG